MSRTGDIGSRRARPAAAKSAGARSKAPATTTTLPTELARPVAADSFARGGRRASEVGAGAPLARAHRAPTLNDLLDAFYSEKGMQLSRAIRKHLEADGVSFAETDQWGTLICDDAASAISEFHGDVSWAIEAGGVLPEQLDLAFPQALVAALAKHADRDGNLDLHAVEAAAGKPVARLLKQALGAPRGSVTDSGRARLRLKYLFCTDELTAQIGRSRPAGELAPDMRALADVTKRFGGPYAVAGWRLVARQHLFPSTATLFDELRANGVSPGQAQISGKPYSTDDDAYAQLLGEGWQINAFARTARSGREFWDEKKLNPDYLTYVSTMLSPDKVARIKDARTLGVLVQLVDTLKDVNPRHRDSKVLVLDDGGEHVKALHEFFPDYVGCCVAVEQTDRGIQKLEGMQLDLPVINVARSWIKKVLEAPMIGESVAWGIEKQLAELNPALRPNRKEATIIGYGAVGKAAADALRRRGYEVYVYDIDPAKMKAAAADGCVACERTKALEHAHLLVSCTGREDAVTIRDQELMPDGAILANAASDNHELGMHREPAALEGKTRDPNERIGEDGIRRSNFKGLDVRLGDFAAEDEQFHRVMRTKNGKSVLMMRSGYVVNMKDDIPPQFIQLTRCALLAACLQAVKSKGQKGLIDLDADMQKFVGERVQHYLGELGLDLMAPDFRKLDGSVLEWK